MKRNIYPWLVVGMLWVVALLNYIDRQMLSTLKSTMQVDISKLNSAENFGRLMAIFLWIYALLSPFAGTIADRLNRKWLIVASLFVWSFVTLMMGYTTDFNQLYALRALMGISEAFYIPAGLALIADYHQGKTRSLAIGVHTTGIYLGQAIGGFGITIAHNYSWQAAFHSIGLIGIIYSLLLIFFLKEKKGYHVEPTGEKSILSELSGAFKGMGMLFSMLSFWVILFYFSAPSLPGWATKNWLPTLCVESLKIPMTQAGPLATITISLASLVGVLIGGILSDRWVQKNLRGRIFTGTLGLVLTVPALFSLGYGNCFTTIFGGAICFGLGFGMFDVNSMPILCQFVSPRYRATGYGIMNLTGISAGAFITTYLGKSSDAGHLGRDFALLSLFVTVTIVITLAMLKPTVINKTEG
ncbi:MAG: MFS transporter [Bacteroidota bacterium]|nr:MFS transporter [Bacteroidota bacterium]